MKTRRKADVLLGTVAALLVAGLVTVAWAQGSPAPPPPTVPSEGARGGLGLAIALVLGFLVIIGGTAKLLDLRRKREADAVQLQAQVSDALLRDPALFRVPVTPMAHVPMWTGSPATLEVAGQVPSRELREAILRLVQQEASRIRSDVHIVDRITVVPEPHARAA